MLFYRFLYCNFHFNWKEDTLQGSYYSYPWSFHIKHTSNMRETEIFSIYLEWTLTSDLKKPMVLHLDVPESDKKQ